MTKFDTILSNDTNSRAKFPFVDSATLQSRENYLIPHRSIVDLRYYGKNTKAPVYISQILSFPNYFVINFSDSESRNIASADSRNSRTLNDGYVSITIKQPHDVDAGTIIVNKDIFVRSLPADGETLVFASNATEFVSSVIFSNLDSGVTGIVDESGTRINDEVWLIGKDGIVLEDTGNHVTVHASGDPLYKRKLKGGDPAQYSTVRALKALRLNNSVDITPDQYGNINFILNNATAIAGSTGLLPSSGAVTANADNIFRVKKEDTGIKLELLGNFD